MMKLSKILLIILFVSAIVFAQTDSLQIIRLKDGSVVKGTIVEQDEKEILIQTYFGKMVVPQSEILNIDYGGKEIKPLTSEIVSPGEIGIAEIHLEKLAKKAETSRKAGGGVLIGLGVVSTGIGLAVAGGSQNDDDKTAGYIVTGAGLTLGLCGGLVIGIKSESEKDYHKVIGMDISTIEARAKREYSASIALEALSNRAKTGRITSAVISFVAAVAVFTIRPYKESYITYDWYGWPSFAQRESPWNDYNAITFAATGVLTLLLESEEEKAYKRYLKDKGIP